MRKTDIIRIMKVRRDLAYNDMMDSSLLKNLGPAYERDYIIKLTIYNTIDCICKEIGI